MALPRGVGFLPRALIALSLFVTFCGFVVIVAGLSTIQRATNALGPPAKIPAEIVNAYDTTYTQALVQPYPTEHGFQFAYIWFIIFGQLAVFLFCALIAVVPGLLHTCRAAALTLLAILCTLTITVVNNLVFFHKSSVANSVYGSTKINVTLAGALLVVLGNGFTILSMGIGSPLPASHAHPLPVKEQPAAVAV